LVAAVAAAWMAGCGPAGEKEIRKGRAAEALGNYAEAKQWYAQAIAADNAAGARFLAELLVAQDAAELFGTPAEKDAEWVAKAAALDAQITRLVRQAEANGTSVEGVKEALDGHGKVIREAKEALEKAQAEKRAAEEAARLKAEAEARAIAEEARRKAEELAKQRAAEEAVAAAKRNLFAKARKASEDGNVDFFGFYIGMPAEDAWALAKHYELPDGEWSLRSANGVVYRLRFSLKGLRKLTKRGNSFKELAQEVANQVGDLRRNDDEWIYKTIDGVLVRVRENGKWETLSKWSPYHKWKIKRPVSLGVTLSDSDKMSDKIQAAAPAIRQKRAQELGRGKKAGETRTIKLPGGAPMTLAWCDGFWMAKTEVTRRQWKSVMWGNGASFEGGDYPQGYISWNEWHCFCELAGLEFPSKSEWEKACLAGGAQPSEEALDKMAWYDKNCDGEPHPVGQKTPNAWGLFDMYGNVAEGCSDWEKVTEVLNAWGERGQYDVRVSYCGGRPADKAPTAGDCFNTKAVGSPETEVKFLGFRPIVKIPDAQVQQPAN
jgi:tetratricopeptide (TPR) repeat protein